MIIHKLHMLNTVVSYVFLAWDTVPLRCSLSITWRESIETFLFIDIVFSISILVLCSVSLYWYVFYISILVLCSISLYWYCCVLYLYIGVFYIPLLWRKKQVGDLIVKCPAVYKTNCCVLFPLVPCPPSPPSIFLYTPINPGGVAPFRPDRLLLCPLLANFFLSF